MQLRRAFLFAAVTTVLGLASTARGQAPDLPDKSPFLPPAGAPNAEPAAPSGYEFVGMTVVGDDTLVSILRLSGQRSLWIPVGRTVNEVTAVSYHSGKEEVVIRAEGRQLTLPLRKSIASTAAGPQSTAPSPVPGPAPSVEVPVRPLTAQEEKEMEARMLVSDLLEIGQQQRKAYAEAQRQAAAKAAAKPAPLPAPIKTEPSPPPAPVTSSSDRAKN